MTVIAYLHTPIDADHLRNLLIGLDATVTVNDDGVLVIEANDRMVTTTGPESIDMHNYDSEPDPLVCVVCWEPVEYVKDRGLIHSDPMYFKRSSKWHDATLTPPERHSKDDVTAALESDRPQALEPPVGTVVRCFGCGNVYVHKADGWVDTDNRAKGLAWDELGRPSCGPLRVIYRSEADGA